MSTYWRLHCQTCNEVAEMDSINGGDDTIAMMVLLADSLETVEGRENHDYDLQVDFKYAPTYWIRQHRGHTLAAVSEYGEARAISRRGDHDDQSAELGERATLDSPDDRAGGGGDRDDGSLGETAH